MKAQAKHLKNIKPIDTGKKDEIDQLLQSLFEAQQLRKVPNKVKKGI